MNRALERTRNAKARYGSGNRVAIVLSDDAFEELRRRALADDRTLAGMARLLLEASLLRRRVSDRDAAREK
jgi:hypothetical protein